MHLNNQKRFVFYWNKKRCYEKKTSLLCICYRLSNAIEGREYENEILLEKTNALKQSEEVRILLKERSCYGKISRCYAYRIALETRVKMREYENEILLEKTIALKQSEEVCIVLK